MFANFVVVPAPPSGWLPYLTPVATVLAAGSAVWLGLRLQRLQKAIAASQIEVAMAAKEVAESQRDIAMDKLKLDLFNRRYALYRKAIIIARDTARSYLDGTAFSFTEEDFAELDEAAFLFSKEGASAFATISHAANDVKVFASSLERMKSEGNPNADDHEMAMLQRLKNLQQAGFDLRRLISKDMSFEHLKPR
jgi:hypothetical protein